MRGALIEAAHAELAEHGHAGISLRAVARRAGVSHAAPKHHFDDRAGLLTAVAADGFDTLTAALQAAATSDAGRSSSALAALGRAYISFGLTEPALYDLMFRPSELHPDDPILLEAEAAAIGELGVAVASTLGPAASAAEVQDMVLTSWALVHGLVGLARDGSLGPSPDKTRPDTGAVLAFRLAEVFTERVLPVAADRRVSPGGEVDPQRGEASSSTEG